MQCCHSPQMQVLSLRVHVPNIWVPRVLVIVIIVQVSGKYMIIEYLEFKGVGGEGWVVKRAENPTLNPKP